MRHKYHTCDLPRQLFLPGSILTQGSSVLNAQLQRVGELEVQIFSNPLLPILNLYNITYQSLKYCNSSLKKWSNLFAHNVWFQ